MFSYRSLTFMQYSKIPMYARFLQKKYYLSGMLKVEFMVYLQIHTKITWNL